MFLTAPHPPLCVPTETCWTETPSPNQTQVRSITSMFVSRRRHVSDSVWLINEMATLVAGEEMREERMTSTK